MFAGLIGAMNGVAFAIAWRRFISRPRGVGRIR
jgi:hypothetical protein